MQRVILSHNGNAAEHLDRLEADHNPLVLLHLSAEEVASGRTSSALDRLMNLSDSARNTKMLEARLCLAVSGYDHDPRELYQIPEVVQYFRQLTNVWPFWAHFAARFDDTIGIVIRQLVDVDTVEAEPGLTSCQIRDLAQFNTILQRMFEGLNTLHAHHCIPAKRTLKTTEDFMDTVRRLFDPRPGAP